MSSSKEPDAPEDTIRKIIHDLNGEIFLIRGNTEIATDALPPGSPAEKNLNSIMERTNEINAIVQRLRAKQHIYEGKPSK